MVVASGDEAVAIVRVNKETELEVQVLTPEQVHLLVEALKTNTALTTLDLGYNSIGTDGAKALADALKTNTTLTTLALYWNSIGADGVKALAQALTENATIETLKLGHGVIALAIAMSKAATIRKLAVGTYQQQFEDCISAFRAGSNIGELDLDDIDMSIEDTLALGEALKENQSLTTLNLERCRIDDDGAEALAEALKTNTALTTLNLENNKIGNDGAKSLADALKENKTLTTLNLESDRMNIHRDVYYETGFIGDDGAKALADALKANTALTTLFLGGNDIGNEGIHSLSIALVEQVLGQGHLVLRDLRVDNDTGPLPQTGQLEYLPANVLNGGLGSVIDYLKHISTHDSRRRVKMLVVGDGGAGKTTLLNLLQRVRVRIPCGMFFSHEVTAEVYECRLRFFDDTGKLTREINLYGWFKPELDAETNNVALMPPSGSNETKIVMQVKQSDTGKEFVKQLYHATGRQITHGIEVRQFKLEDVQNQSVEIVAWDFAGQHEYFHSHHHFLSDQALYVVVWDVSKKDDAKAEAALVKWLIALRVQLPRPGKSMYSRYSILIVGTHIDEPNLTSTHQGRKTYIKFLARQAGLLPFYGDKIKIMEMSALAEAPQEFLEVKRSLADTAIVLGGPGLLVDESLNIVEKEMDELTHERESWPIVTLSEFVFSDKVKFDYALKLLYSWGRIIYQPRISAVIVLSPAYLTQVTIGELFKENKKFVKNGILSKDSLSVMWGQHAELTDDLIKLMEEFEILYQRSESEFVLPALLPEEKPVNFANWSGFEQNGFCRVYHLDVVPDYLVPRILSRLHKIVKIVAAWRHGVIFTEKDSMVDEKGCLYSAMDESGPGGKIYIRIRPSEIGDLRLLEKIVKEIGDCIGLYPGVVCEEWIECSNEKFKSLAEITNVLAKGKDTDIALAALKHAGHTTPTIDNIATLPFSDVVLKELSKVKSTDIVAQAKECLANNYPFLLLPVPSKKLEDWTKPYDHRNPQKLFVLPLCEFSSAGKSFCHPIAGVKPFDLDLKGAQRDLVFPLKATANLLKDSQSSSWFNGQPFFSAAGKNLSNLVINIIETLRDHGTWFPNNNVSVRTRDYLPERLHGNYPNLGALTVAQGILGTHSNGYLESAQLYRTLCPDGACMWLCKEHRDLVVNRGNFDQRGKDISSQQWYKFFGLSQPIAPQGVDVNRAPDYDVFLSHAGTEKQGIVSFIYKYLTNAKLEVFVDYDDKKSLRPADHAPTKMEQAAWTAPVGLFVLSKEFLQRKWPVKELRIFLERRKNGENVKILPCFYGLDAWEKDPSLTSEQKSLLREVSEFTGRERRFGLSFEEALVSRLTLDVVQLVAEAKDQGGSSTQAGSTSALAGSASATSAAN